MRISRLSHVTLTILVSLTIVPLVLLDLPVTLKMGVWTHLTAAVGLSAVVGTAAFPRLVCLGVVLAGDARVAVPLAWHLLDHNSSMVIIAGEAGALPVMMFLMRLGMTLINPRSTSPLPT